MRAVNLGTARIVVIVALVVAGAVVLANGFPESGASVAGPSGGASPSGSASSPTTTPTTPPPPGPSPQTTGVSFTALNGTSVTGAGAAAQALLVKHGYNSVQDATNAPSTGVTTTTIYYVGGQASAQNRSNAAYVAKTYFKGAAVKKLDVSLQSLVPATASIVVVVGQDYAQSLVP